MIPPTLEFSKINRANLDNYIVKGIWSGHNAKAELKVIELSGKRFVVKDFSGKGILSRSGIAKLLIKREYKIYSLLKGIKGIPEVYHKIDDEAFIMEYIDAKPLKDFYRDLVPPIFVTRLEKLVKDMHQRGVIHLDLHQRRNILVTADWKPYLLDFATSIYFGTSAFAQEVLVPIFSIFDSGGIFKIKKWHAPSTFTSVERRNLRIMEKFRRLWIFTPVHISKRKPPEAE